MALKQVYSEPMPQLPAWANSADNIRDFQNFATTRGFKFKNWDNIKAGKTPGYGNFGAQTQAAFSQYGKDFRPTLRANTVPRIGGTSSYTPSVKFPVSATSVPSSAPTNNSSNALSTLKGLIPFASNVANQFRRAPNPTPPGILSPVQFSKVSYANERANADNLVRGADIGAERALDGNTSQAVKASNLAAKMKVYGDSYTREANQNAEITNQQTQVNTGIEDRNLRVTDAFNQQKLEKNLAEQRERSQNLANAADKFTALQNEKAKKDADVQVAKINSRLTSGINSNYADWLKKQGIELGAAYETPKMRFGGRLKKAY